MDVARPDCRIGSKDEIEWISAKSLEKCQNWAENKCNATIAVYWPDNWCEGYTTSCKYGEEAFSTATSFVRLIFIWYFTLKIHC